MTGLRVTKGKRMDRVVFGDPVYRVSQRVTITEPGLRPWTGTIITIKPSSVSGWWYDVRNDDMDTWSFTEDYLKEVAS